MIVALVAAMARNGVIGRANQIPWRLPEDLRHFRAVTLGAPVLMGRQTWDSLPPRFRPLPGRRNLVLTRQSDWHADGAEVVHSMAHALQDLDTAGAMRVSVIGGAAVYALALPRADELQLTEIERDFDGDRFFPPWPRGQFDEVCRQHQRAQAPDDFDYSFVTYRRRRPSPPLPFPEETRR
jgi:dihydrofolate reductase